MQCVVYERRGGGTMERRMGTRTSKARGMSSLPASEEAWASFLRIRSPQIKIKARELQVKEILFSK